MIIAAALYHVRDGSSIDLKMERQIPSKVRNPQNNQTPARLSAAVPIETMQTKTRMRKTLVGEVNLDFIAGCYACDLFLASAAFMNAQSHTLRAFRRNEMEKILAKIK